LLSLALLTYAAVGLTDVERQAGTPIVVMLSLDGFRHDYLEQYPQQSKNLKRMADSGLQVAGLIPGFSQQHISQPLQHRHGSVSR
jgi:hypothetical protein